ncbi:lipopolysaccharide heptosyltransferase II [Pectinatus sottacetonis]|uniref:lipopolysaccharide heptosyltransferase II n=1 Tax=Pectinatus sottacetonis TaxID=1002795 RepID=UPI0018C521A8|nr:lipopolysaccharide heptosyltransferase II [Pectinatus sottacetonis]
MTKNILIIKLSAIGDVIHALPTASAIKNTWPDAHITWVVSPVAADIVKDCPAIDDIILFDRKKLNSFWGFINYIKPFSHKLQQKHYDICLDLQGLLKSALIAYLSHADIKLGYVNMREGSGFISKPIKGEYYNGHIVERYLDVVRFLGCNTENISFPLGITDENITDATALLKTNNISITAPYVVFIVGANWPNKRWPARYFSWLADWCKTQNLTVLLAGAGKTDKKISAEILAGTSVKCINLVNNTTLKELAYIIKNAAAVIGGDTGSMHMAAALNIPAVMVMGPTDAVRNGPYNQKHNTIEVSYDCKHCWKRKCRFHRDCLAAIKPQQVADKLRIIFS